MQKECARDILQIDRKYFACHVQGMDKQIALQNIERRAVGVRKPLYKVCLAAGVAPSTISRWRRNIESASWTTIGQLEDALSKLEAERAS